MHICIPGTHVCVPYNNIKMKNRKPNRLRNYDYSQNGMYFITVCTKNRFECFGEIKNGEMVLNELGKIAEKCYLEIPNHFPDVFPDEFVIMPNHIHAIIEINVGNAEMRSGTNGNIKINRNADPRSKIKNNGKTNRNARVRSLQNDRTKMLLSKIIHGFKASATKEINRMKNYNIDFQWQKSFYDHIIRNEISLNKIREYIQTNPVMWERDRNNIENLWM